MKASTFLLVMAVIIFVAMVVSSCVVIDTITHDPMPKWKGYRLVEVKDAQG